VNVVDELYKKEHERQRQREKMNMKIDFVELFD
jgi:hypothetical protein